MDTERHVAMIDPDQSSFILLHVIRDEDQEIDNHVLPVERNEIGLVRVNLVVLLRINMVRIYGTMMA